MIYLVGRGTWFLRLLVYLAWIVAVCGVLGCGIAEPRQERGVFLDTVAGRQLAERLQGVWDLRTVLYRTSCPEEYVRNPMMGQTSWKAIDHRVLIEWITGGMYSMDLWATSLRTLERSVSTEILGCQVNAENVITFSQVETHSIDGEYREYYIHNQAEVCTIVAEDFSLPQQCEMVVQFVGKRLMFDANHESSRID